MMLRANRPRRRVRHHGNVMQKVERRRLGG
jgi:hypothetical protein